MSKSFNIRAAVTAIGLALAGAGASAAGTTSTVTPIAVPAGTVAVQGTFTITTNGGTKLPVTSNVTLSAVPLTAAQIANLQAMMKSGYITIAGTPSATGTTLPSIN